MLYRAAPVLRQQTTAHWKRDASNTTTRALRRKELLARSGVSHDRHLLSGSEGEVLQQTGTTSSINSQQGSTRSLSTAVPWLVPSVSPVREVPAQANLRNNIQHAATWEAAVVLFSQTTTHDVAPTPRMYATLAYTLMERRAQSLALAGQSVAALLDDARTSSTERWEVTPQERRDLARYVLREVNREASVAEVAYDAHMGMFVEGPDHALVTLLEASMRRHHAAPGMDAIADLASLKVNWLTSLRLMRLAREAHGVLPITELYERTMQLSVGSGKTSFGTRPWRLALSLYEECVSSGNDLTTELHTRALQALWRSGQRTWISNHDGVNKQHAQAVWTSALHILQRAQQGSVRGNEGCRLYEAAVQALMHSGHWEGALAIVGGMELAESDTTSALLIPTPTTLAECVSGMLRAGNHFKALQFADLFESYQYKWNTLPTEVLRPLLAMCRVALRNGYDALPTTLLTRVIRTDSAAGGATSLLLDRTIAVECLLLLARRRLVMEPEARWTTALRLVGAYDANLWPQHPIERSGELALVFQGVRRIASLCSPSRRVGIITHPIEQQVGQWILCVFGGASAEYEWWGNSLVHKLHALPEGMPWQQGLGILDRLLSRRSLSPSQHPSRYSECGIAFNLKYLPVPYRQLLLMVAVNSWRSLDSRTSLFVDEEDCNDDEEPSQPHNTDANAWSQTIDGTVRFLCDSLYSSPPTLHDTAKPWWIVGYLRMLQARLAHDANNGPAAKELSDAALDALGRAPMGASKHISSGVVIDAVTALSMSTEQVEIMLNDSHYVLRRNALARASPQRTTHRSEMFYW
jgi:hypothetical protein